MLSGKPSFVVIKNWYFGIFTSILLERKVMGFFLFFHARAIVDHLIFHIFDIISFSTK